MPKFAATLVTTGVNPSLHFEDLGDLTIDHPDTVELADFLAQDELVASDDLQEAIDSGWITVTNANGALISDVIDLLDINILPNTGGVSYPEPRIDSVTLLSRVGDISTVKITGYWLNPDTLVSVTSPSGVVVANVVSATLDELIFTADVSTIGGSTDVNIILDNYTRTTIFSDTSPTANLVLLLGQPSLCLDLRLNQGTFTTSKTIAGGNVLIWNDSGANFDRDAVKGWQSKGNEGGNNRTWFKFLDASFSRDSIEKVEFIVYYGSGGRFYVGLGNGRFNESTGKNAISKYIIAAEFRSNDLRNIVGLEDDDDDELEIVGISQDITQDRYYRVEINLSGSDPRVYLYELASADPSDWWTTPLTDILDLDSDELEDFAMEDSTYAPVIHYVDSSVDHGVLAIKVTEV